MGLELFRTIHFEFGLMSDIEMELEVERAHIIRARAEPELFKSSPGEPEPMDFCHRVGSELSLNQFFRFFGIELTLKPEKKARQSFKKIGPGRPGLLT